MQIPYIFYVDYAVILVTRCYNTTMNPGVNKKLDAFFSHYPLVTFKKGSVLFDAGRQPTGIYYIVEGIVRRYCIFENGHEITLNLYKPHSFLPMSWAIADIPNDHIYETLTKCKTYKAPQADVLKFLQQEPDVVYDLLRRVYVGMEGLWKHIELVTSGTSLIKLAASLVILAKRFGSRQNEEKILIQIPMGQQEIANYAGMSRETASREFQVLKKRHIAFFDKGNIIIEDMNRLEELLSV